MARLHEKMKDILSQGIMTANWETWENGDFEVICITKIRLLQYFDRIEIKNIVSM